MDLSGIEPELNNEIEDEDLSFSTGLFYEEFADTAVRLKDGKEIKFNKTALLIHAKSKILYQIFHGNLRDPDVTDISDIDYDSFKLFLDCCMGFEPYTSENALKIFPVVWKYQITHLIDKCVKALELKEISPQLCEVLNMAIPYNCIELLNKAYSCICSSYNVYKILENEEFCHLLEPEAIKALLSRVPKDSHLLKVVLKWADYYMKQLHQENEHSTTLRGFLEKCELLQFLKLEYFETTRALAEFSRSEFGKEIFDFDEVLAHIQNSEILVHGKSEWKRFKEGDSITEGIFIPIKVDDYPSRVYDLAAIRIERNKVIFYDKFKKDEKMISMKVNFFGQEKNGMNFIRSHKLFEITQGTVNRMSHSCTITTHTFNLDNISQEGCYFKITWTFLQDCRALLMNRQGDKLNGSNEMYYTKNISLNFEGDVLNEAIIP